MDVKDIATQKQKKRKKKKRKKAKKEDWSVPEELMVMYDVYTRSAKSIPITDDSFVEILSLHIFSMLNIFDKMSLLFVSKLFYKLLTSSDSYQRLILDPYYFDLTKKGLYQKKAQKENRYENVNFMATTLRCVEESIPKRFIHANDADPVQLTNNFIINIKTVSNLKQIEFKWISNPKQYKYLHKLLSVSPKLETLIFHEFQCFDDEKNNWMDIFPFPKMNLLKHLALAMYKYPQKEPLSLNSYKPTATLTRFLQHVPQIHSLHILTGIPGVTQVMTDDINGILKTIQEAITSKSVSLLGLKVLRISEIKLDLIEEYLRWNVFVDILSKWKTLDTLIMDFVVKDVDMKTHSNQTFVRGALRQKGLILMKNTKLKCVSISFNNMKKQHMLRIRDSFSAPKEMKNYINMENYRAPKEICFQFHNDLMKQNCDGKTSYYRTKKILERAFKTDTLQTGWDYYYHSRIEFDQCFGLFYHG